MIEANPSGREHLKQVLVFQVLSFQQIQELELAGCQRLLENLQEIVQKRGTAKKALEARCCEVILQIQIRLRCQQQHLLQTQLHESHFLQHRTHERKIDETCYFWAYCP